MTITISAVEVRKNLGKFLSLVSLRGDEVVIERDGKPVAKLGPVGSADRLPSGRLDLRRLRGLGREAWKGIDVARYLREERETWG